MPREDAAPGRDGATDDILPAEQEKGIFQHYGMTCQPGVNGERQLARR